MSCLKPNSPPDSRRHPNSGIARVFFYDIDRPASGRRDIPFGIGAKNPNSNVDKVDSKLVVLASKTEPASSDRGSKTEHRTGEARKR